MFIGNLIIDAIGGIIIGLYSDNIKQIFVFAIGWILISIINLFIFERKDFSQWRKIREGQEIKMQYQSKIPHKIDWIIVRLFSSYIIVLLVGLLTQLIKFFVA